MAERVAVHELDDVVAPLPAGRPHEADGPGVTAVRALFAAGEPKPTKVVELLDKHRGERDAIFAFLQAQGGNGYVARVQAELDDLRFSIERREVVAGDPASPDDGFFHGSAERRGAAWRTESGRFRGEIDDRHTDIRYQHDADTALTVEADHRERTGRVALEDEGRVVGQLDGHYRSASDWHAGVTRPLDVGEGRSASASVRHQVRPTHGASDVVAGTYRDQATTADGFVGRHESGGVTAGGTFRHTVDPRTSVTGAFETSPVATSYGVTGTRVLDGDRTVSGGVRRQAHPGHGTSDEAFAAWRDPSTTAEVHAGRHESGGLAGGGSFSHTVDPRTSVTGRLEASPDTPTSYDLTGTRTFSGDRSASAGVRRQARPEHGTTDEVFASWRDPSTTAEVHGGRHESGGVTAGGSFSHAFDGRSSLSGAVDHSPLATTASLTGSSRPTDRLTLGGSVSHVDRRHGADVTSLTLSESYRSERLHQQLELSAERTAEGTHARGSGSLDAQLGPRLYGSAFGSFDTAAGGRDTLGGSLTFTPHERAALTLAGVIDGSGAFETRLQLDVFKKRIEGLSTISSAKKEALVSLFVSYTQGAAPGMLDERFGRGQYGGARGMGEGTVGAGIRIRF